MASSDMTVATSSKAVDIEAPSFEVIYCCRRCREPLFRASMVTTHEVGAHGFSYRRMKKEQREVASGGGGASAGSGGEQHACTSIFVAEALKWMAIAAGDVEGKLLCPKCAVRVGSLDWAGSQCSCGTWVSPAIQITRKMVDERTFELMSLPVAAVSAATTAN